MAVPTQRAKTAQQSCQCRRRAPTNSVNPPSLLRSIQTLSGDGVMFICATPCCDDADQHFQTSRITSSCLSSAATCADEIEEESLPALQWRRSGLFGGLADQMIASLGNFA